jgi:hypothetical protein
MKIVKMENYKHKTKPKNNTNSIKQINHSDLLKEAFAALEKYNIPNVYKI